MIFLHTRMCQVGVRRVSLRVLVVPRRPILDILTMATNSVTWDIGDGWIVSTNFEEKLSYLMDVLICEWLLWHQLR